MIAKGNRHNNGARLARYLTEGAEGERAQLFELRGFASDDIFEAFRDVHVMAEGTKAQKPFFHVQVRNPEGETLTREQWRTAADRIERILGLTGQPRAIAFHIEERNGDEHMHIAFSLIDAETLKVRPLPFYKFRLKTISRELEKEFGLTIVTNERDSAIKYAATRGEEQQAQRLGLDKEEIRNTIRACWDRADCGQAFLAGLEHEGLILTLGDRRNLVAVDHLGGLHALGKRILDVNKTAILERLSDLDLNALPHVEHVRELIREKQPDRLGQLSHELAQVDRELYGPALDGLKHELAEAGKLIAAADPEQVKRVRERLDHEEAQKQIDALNRATRRGLQRDAADLDKFIAAEMFKQWEKYPNRFETHWRPALTPGVEAELEKLIQAHAERTYAQRDPVREEMAWQDAIARASIEKEKIERQFFTPEDRKLETRAGRDGSAEKERQPEQEAALPPNLKGPAAEIWTALHRSDNARAFAAALDEREIALAAVTKDEAQRSRINASFAREIGRFSPEYREGEIVTVALDGKVYPLNRRTAGKEREEIEAFLAPLDRSQLQGIAATKESQQKRRNEKLWPTLSPQPEPIKTVPGLHLEDAARAATEPEPAPAMPPNLKGPAAHIWTAYNVRIHMQERERKDLTGDVEKYTVPITLKGGRDPHRFAEALEEKGMALARATKDEAERSQQDAGHWKTHGERRPTYREGEFVAVTQRGEVYSLNRRTTGHDPEKVQQFLAKADWKALPGIEAARETMRARAEQHSLERGKIRGEIAAARLGRATNIWKHAPERGRRKQSAIRPAAAIGAAAMNAVKPFGLLGNVLEGLIAPKLTPKQKLEGEIARHEREDTAAEKKHDLEFSQHLAALREQEQQRQAGHEKQQQARDRERDR
jgi:MobA/VirD2-like, nuclease domain